MARKSATPDCLRLLVETLQKAPPSFGDLPRKNVHAGLPPAFGQSPAKRPVSLRRFTPKKTFRPDRLRLLVNPLQKVSLAFGDMPRKNVETRWPSAFGQSFSENLSSDPLRRLEKVQLQTAFGFGSMLSKKPLQPSEIYPGKMFTPDCLRLLVNPLQKVSPASGDMPRKNVHARWLSALG